MKEMYIECGMGAAGDMLSAALLEVTEDPEKTLRELNCLGIPGVEYRAIDSVKCGIHGTHMKVLVQGVDEADIMDHHHHHHHDTAEPENADGHSDLEGHEHHHHHHTSMDDIRHIVSELKASDRVKDDIISVYSLIARAESEAHHTDVSQIHFHEVGSMDAVADVAAVSYLMEKIAPDRVTVSPVHTGYGQVHCAHGILPVPAPATAWLLKGIPCSAGDYEGELCTPTGAALIRHFAGGFGNMPDMTLESTGYGMGHRDFPRANCVRVMLGSSAESVQNRDEQTSGEDLNLNDTITELTCNIDDMTGEDMGYLMERCYDDGASEVYITSAVTKKSRPSFVFHVLVKPELKEKLVRTIYNHSTTLGIREQAMNRFILDRREETVKTDIGDCRIKTSEGYGVSREKLEYDDVAALAREYGLSLSDIRSMIQTYRQ